MRERSFSDRVMQVIVIVILAILSFLFVFPIWHVIMYSMSRNPTEGRLLLWPNGITFKGYKMILSDYMLWRSYLNTILVTAFGTILNLVMTFLAAYPLTRRDLKGRKIIQYMIFLTMLFGGGIIPTYLVVRGCGMVNTLWSLIIPNALSAYNIFVLRNFLQSLPESLLEAARIDSAGEAYILTRIVIPLSKPVLAVLALLYGVGHWNSWFDCIIYINNTRLYTLQPILREVLFSMGVSNYFGYDAELTETFMPAIVKMCCVVVAVVPVLCVYPFLQKYFVKGVTLGAVKG